MRRQRIGQVLGALATTALLLSACGWGGRGTATPTTTPRPTATAIAPRPTSAVPTGATSQPAVASATDTTTPTVRQAAIATTPAGSATVATPTRSAAASATRGTPETAAATIGPPPTALPTAVPPTATRPPALTYPTSLNVVTEATYTLDGEQVTVGLPPTFVGDPRVPEVIRDYLRAYRAADRAFETGDEALLAQVLTGPMLERELQGLRDDKAKGQSVRFGRTGRVLAIYTIAGDQAGVYDAFIKADTIINSRTGQVIQSEAPHPVRVLSALRRIGDGWKWYDARSFIE